MGPVQTILTGQRSALGGALFLDIGSTSKITQSMCRSIADSGKEQSACVACQASCIDIDSERHYWQFLRGKRGLAWAWYSYPGLILMFFELMMAVEAHMAPQDSELTYFVKDVMINLAPQGVMAAGLLMPHCLRELWILCKAGFRSQGWL